MSFAIALVPSDTIGCAERKLSRHFETDVNAVEQVRRRLLLASETLRAAEVPYALIGGNAVAAWVATVDESAVRNT